jgi:hypothetical protein
VGGKEDQKSKKGRKRMKLCRWLPILICASFITVLFSPGFETKIMAQVEQGNTKPEERSKETTIKDEFSKEKEEFKKETKEKLKKFDMKMRELEAKVKEAGSEATAETKKEWQELKAKRTALKKDVEKIESSSRKTWETVKKKVKDGMDELEEAYNKMRDKFK